MLGGGGYVAGPVGLAALAARIPLVLTEADSHLGITNRLLAPRARRVCLAFPIAGRGGSRYLVTGRPVPPPATDVAAARRRFGLAEGELCVLVFGGSLGARTINEAAVEAFRAAPFRVLHAAGTRDHADLARRVAGAHYDLRPYIDDFGEALAACDLVVARAGGSIFEIAAAGKPAILVPYPLRQRRPPDGERALDGRRGRGGRRARRRADLGAAGQRGRGAARRSVAAGGDGERVGGARAARRGAGGRRRAARRGAQRRPVAAGGRSS